MVLDIIITSNEGLQQKGSPFSQISMLQKHTCTSNANKVLHKKVSKHQFTKCYTRCQELTKEDIIKKDTTHSGIMQVSTLEKRKCHALPHRFYIQPKACRSVQSYRRPTNLPHLPEAKQHLPHAVRPIIMIIIRHNAT
jgi:hypothetical protein